MDNDYQIPNAKKIIKHVKKITDAAFDLADAIVDNSNAISNEVKEIKKYKKKNSEERILKDSKLGESPN
jgi:hypothetical protein